MKASDLVLLAAAIGVLGVVIYTARKAKAAPPASGRPASGDSSAMYGTPAGMYYNDTTSMGGF